MEIAIPLYEDFTALDAVGPYEVLSRLPGARVRFLTATASAPTAVRTDNRMLELVAEASLEDVPRPDVLVVPGGISRRRASPTTSATGRWIRTRPRDVDLDDVGVLGRAAPGRGRDARRRRGDDALARPREPAALRRHPGRASASSSSGKVITAAGVSVGHRHGAPPGRADRGRRRRAGDPARHRVRPPAAVRRRVAAQGRARRRRPSSARPSTRAGARERAPAARRCDGRMRGDPAQGRGARRARRYGRAAADGPTSAPPCAPHFGFEGFRPGQEAGGRPPPEPAATCSSSCPRARASRSATSCRRSCATT